MSVRFLCGDAIETLRTLPDESVQCVVTSPPYYGLRDYAVDGQIGLEETPDDYVTRLVEVFREVRRVLRGDGTLWLNLGDSYAHYGSGSPGDGNKSGAYDGIRNRKRHPGILKYKDRMMVPARTAIALQADGWWLRDEVVWHKPRTTPAPVVDRTVSAHEMVYLFTKRPRYFFDWAAIEEPAAYAGVVRHRDKAFRKLEGKNPNSYSGAASDPSAIIVRETRRKRSVWSISPEPYKDAHFATMPKALAEVCVKAGSRPGDTVLDPFGGAGTTALVADKLGRDAILCELNPGYVSLARRRLGYDFRSGMDRLAAAFGEAAAARA